MLLRPYLDTWVVLVRGTCNLPQSLASAQALVCNQTRQKHRPTQTKQGVKQGVDQCQGPNSEAVHVVVAGAEVVRHTSRWALSNKSEERARVKSAGHILHSAALCKVLIGSLTSGLTVVFGAYERARAARALSRPSAGIARMVAREALIYVARSIWPTPTKSKGGKAAKAPDSGSSFFTRETDDEDKARRQRQLFEKDLVSCLGSAGGSTMDKNKNQKGDNSDSSEGEVIPWADTEAEESDKDVNMDDLAEEISNEVDLDLDDPEVVDGVLRNTYQDLPSVCECEVVTADGSAISTVLYSQGFLKEHNVNPSALQKLVTFATDGAYVINPARQDPCSVVTTTFGQSINPVLSWAPRSGQMVRVICMSLGFVFTCNVVFPASFGKQGTQSVKSITIDEERRNRFLWDDLRARPRYANRSPWENIFNPSLPNIWLYWSLNFSNSGLLGLLMGQSG
ncbi:hypothetical protein C8Q78DRAFT_1106934 [Trametes maxima]|nr:hypothetical protein C8Q78DRAFT_1106934 [Trametes maxima]